jgi:hypothetical protein
MHTTQNNRTTAILLIFPKAIVRFKNSLDKNSKDFLFVIICPIKIIGQPYEIRNESGFLPCKNLFLSPYSGGLRILLSPFNIRLKPALEAGLRVKRGRFTRKICFHPER